MGSLSAQISAVIAMNIRSLPQRFWMSLAAVLAVAVVVAVLLAFQAMGNGFQQTLAGSGSDEVAVVTRVGSRSEVNSVLGRDQLNILETAPGIARQTDGQLLVSGELYVIVDGIKKSSGTEVNLPLRGIDQRGLTLRENITIVDGRMFETGRNEIIVGEGVLRQFAGFELGNRVTFGKTTWEVVGTFSAGGSAFEGEMWADALMVQSQFRRGNSFQSMRLKLSEPGVVDPIRDFIEADPRLNFDIVTEKDYFADQASGLDSLVIIGNALAVAMALGALAGALNTMYTSVSSRARDIATLRAIGFGGLSAFVGTLTESLVLAIIGGVIGTLAAFLLFDGLSASTLGGSFTQVVFRFEFSPQLIVNGIVMALTVGLIGGFFPAWRAARMPVVEAFS